MLYAKIGWNWSSGSGEEDGSVKSLRQQPQRRWWTTNKLWSEKLTCAFGFDNLSTWPVDISACYTYMYLHVWQSINFLDCLFRINWLLYICSTQIFSPSQVYIPLPWPDYRASTYPSVLSSSQNIISPIPFSCKITSSDGTGKTNTYPWVSIYDPPAIIVLPIPLLSLCMIAIPSPDRHPSMLS